MLLPLSFLENRLELDPTAPVVFTMKLLLYMLMSDAVLIFRIG